MFVEQSTSHVKNNKRASDNHTYGDLYTVKNDRDFNGKKLWKCYSKNLLNG